MMVLTTTSRRNLLVMAKEVTREQAETKKEQAATLMERIGEPERADAYRDMSVEEYADSALDAELTREEVVAKIKQVRDLVEPEDEDLEDEDDLDSDEDDDSEG
jgi:hypothetical protein